MKIIIVVFFALFSSNVLSALSLPEPLQEWQEWVLHKHPQAQCSFKWNKFEEKFCAWPATLSLQIKQEGMYFEQHWQVEANSWLTLPGSMKYWPQSVTVDGQPQAVIERGGRPAAYVTQGEYTIKGFIRWSRRPESLPLTPAAALVTLEVDGKSTTPNVDPRGTLLLRTTAQPDKSDQSARLPVKVQVFRKLTDGVPMTLESDLRIRVSGEARELQLGRALPEGFELLSIVSPLPARLEKNGALRVQVRQGSWEIKLKARRTTDADTFAMQSMDKFWPRQEIWVFRSRPQLRAVSVEGVSPIDPQQSNLPQSWRNLPAYLVQQDDQLVLTETSRGDAAPAPDELNLQRDIWLDFDGAGLTVRDQFNGELNKAQRLRTVQPFTLGRAELTGRPQLITTLAKGESGLELSQGTLDLQAVSRIESAQRRVPAIGWDHPVDSLQAVLHLPPGWQLFAARGVDDAPTTWLAKWSLFDIFLLLIISGAFLRLFGKRVGLLVLVTLLITYHTPNAPKYIWLNLALTIALLRVVTRGRVSQLLMLWRNASLLGLLLLVLLFSVQQLQQAVYPMLEKRGYVNTEMRYGRSVSDQADGIEEVMLSAPVAESMRVKKSAPQTRAAPPPQEYDADAFIQTGPGVPTWNWKQASLHWSGPVVETQEMQLYLLSPFVTRMLKLGSVLILLLLFISFLRHPAIKLPRWPLRGTRSSLGLLLASAVLLGQLVPAELAHADIPDAKLLQELEQRLLEPPPCAPACAAVSQTTIRLQGNELGITLSIDALEQVAVPLPAQRGVWLPQQVLLNGTTAEALMSDKNGALHLSIPAGRSLVVLQGPLADDELRLPLALAANNISVNAPGWNVRGLVDGRAPSGTLQFKKIESATPRDNDLRLQPNAIDPFVEIHRVLQLDVDWFVETTVTRIAPTSGAINVNVPLLPGEQLLSGSLKQSNGTVQISLRSGQKKMRWRSSLEKSRGIVLQAPEGNDWSEIWELASDTRWHIEWEGLAPVKQAGNGARINPRWMPRPGERLAINIQEPQALPGASLTVEQVRLSSNPGLRRSATELALQLRAGHAGSYEFTPPKQAQLQKILLDGQEFPLPGDTRQLSLPLHPGTQELELYWQQDNATHIRTETPGLDLNLPATNINLQMRVPEGRWLLSVGGPDIGPAMLVWGVLLVIVAMSVVLGRFRFLPLKTWEWLLLGVGMSTVNVYGSAIMVIWFFAMHARGELSKTLTRGRFNAMQVLLILLTLVAFGSLLSSIPLSLLSSPDMQIAGNGSTGAILNWYQDRSAQLLPQGWILSVPIWVYRVAMLLWSLWLAFAVLKWLQWAWLKFSTGELWRPSSKVVSGTP